MRALAAVLAIAFMLLVSVAAMGAENGAVEVLVHDAATNAAIPLARVVLRGAGAQVGFTDAAGVAWFDALSSGTYRAEIRRNGYVGMSSEPFDVGIERRSIVEVLLARITGPKDIGRVQARSTVHISTTNLDASNPLVKLNGSSLTSALNDLGALSGGFATLDGRDAAQTEVTVDGVPVDGPGLGADMRGLNADLFNGASLSSTSQTAAGGSLDLTTLEPTLAMQTSNAFTFGNPERSAWRSWARGTVGSVGLVFNHSVAGTTGLLDGERFADASGSTYVHRQSATSTGDLLKARLPFSRSTSLTVTGLFGGARFDDVCDRFTGPLPCGIGPNNGATVAGHYSIAAFQTTAGDANITASLLHANNVTRDDQDRRFVNGAASPQAATTDVTVDLGALSWARRDERGITSVRASATKTTVTQTLRSAFSLAAGGTASVENLFVGRAQNLSERLSANIDLGSVRDFTNAPLSIGLRAAWRPTSRDSFSLAFRARGGGVQPIPVGQFRDPAALLYDCAGRSVFTSAPAVAGGRSSISDVRAGWQRRTASSLLSIEGLAQIQRNTVVNTLIDGSAASPGVLPNNYLDAVSQFFGTKAGCDAHVSLTPSNFYVLQPVGGIDRRYRTLKANFARQFHNVTWGAYARYLGATVAGAAAALSDPSSVTVAGRQLPNVPKWSGGIVLDARPHERKVEYLALWQYVGPNNERNLRPYSVLAAGLSGDVRGGQVTFAETNVTNTFAGHFVSFANAVPLVSMSGAMVNVPAQPLPPRSFTLTYTVRTGGAKSTSISAADVGSEPRVASVQYGPLPEAAPVDPYVVDRGDANCTPESAGLAQALVRGVKDFVAIINAAPVSARASLRPDGTTASGFDGKLRYVESAQARWAVSIEPSRANTLGIACLAFAAAGESKDADKLGVVVDPQAQQSIQFYFMPRFDFYAAFGRGTIVSNVGTSRGSRPVTAGPLDIRPECPTSQRPLVSAVLQELQGALHDVVTRKLNSGVTLTTQKRLGATWIEIGFPDPLTRGVFEGCTFTEHGSPGALPPGSHPKAGVIYIPGSGLFTTG